jgi:hypothetical protein
VRWKKLELGWRGALTLQLWDQDVVVAKLIYRSWWTSNATLETPAGIYELDRSFWTGEVIITSEGREVARFRLDWRSRGRLRWRGVDYAWRSEGFWGSSWVWDDARGQPVQRIELGWSLFRPRTEVHVLQPDVSDAPFLAGLGYYVVRQIIADNGTVAAVAASAGAVSAGS